MPEVPVVGENYPGSETTEAIYTSTTRTFNPLPFPALTVSGPHAYPGGMTQPVTMPGDYKGSALGLPPNGVGSLASIGQRILATLIDSLIFLPLTILLFITRTTHLEPRPSTGGTTHFATITDPRPPLVALLILVPHSIYLIVMIGVWGRTLGQRAMGLRVIALDESPPGWNRSVRRWALPALAPILNALHPMLLLVTISDLLIYGWMLWDRNRQGLHDKFAGDVVIRDRA